MKSFFCFFLTSFLFLQQTNAQNTHVAMPGGKGVLYMGFGTNLSFYSKSDLHFVSSNFDFTLYKVRGRDDGGLKFDGGGAAQYSYQLGYYFTKKNFGIEFNFDHIKYFIRQNQVAHLKGVINGQSYDTDTTLTPNFIQFEHSDGANYALFNFVKWKKLASGKNPSNVLNLVLKAGAGPVIPKTNSTIAAGNEIGKHRDDTYKISGFVVALEGGVRYTFAKHFYIMPSIKGAYADYTHFVIKDGYGSQHWFAAHVNLLVGAQVNL